MYQIEVRENIGGQNMLMGKFMTLNRAGVSKYVRDQLNSAGIRDTDKQFNIIQQLEKNKRVQVKNLKITLQEVEDKIYLSGGVKSYNSCGMKQLNGKMCKNAGKYGGKCKRHM